MVINVLLAINGVFSQPKFMPEWLDNPLDYLSEIENQCSSFETDTYRLPDKGFFKQLYNAYASPIISNKNSWKSGMNNIVVTKVEIVYTKYPLHRKDWITNYNQLLAARLKELFSLDNSLNQKDIEFCLILQTKCKTESAAKDFFHGIVIHFELKQQNEVKRRNEIMVDYLPEIRAEEQYNHPPITHPNKKDIKKTKSNQDCPDFRIKKRKVN